MSPLSPFLQQGLPRSLAQRQQVQVGLKAMFSLCSFPLVSAELHFQHPRLPLAQEVPDGHLCCVTSAASLFPSPSSSLQRDFPFLELQLVRSETLSMLGDCGKLRMSENPTWSDASGAAGAADRWHLLPGRTVSLSSCSLLCLMHGLSNTCCCSPVSIPGVMATGAGA